MSNAPTVLFGMVPLVRCTVRSSASATATTVTEDDSGSLFINLSTSIHTYTLPPVANGKGKSWLFYDADTTAAMKVASTAANFMAVDSATGTTLTDGAAIGDCLLVIGDGTNYFGFVISGTWTTA